MSSRQPKLILRESCIDDVSHDWMPASFLEVGAGTGYMTRKFLERGFQGACYDLGEKSRELLRSGLQGYKDRITVVDNLRALGQHSFEYLFAFEVLEHIQDDETTLREWTRYLKPGGRILITVPAHARKFGKSDEIVGHVRRYERHDLTDLLKASGYRDIRILNYGFPLTELTRIVSNLMIAREKEHLMLTPIERSTRSSFSRPQHIRKLLGGLNEGVFSPFKWLQRVFYEQDWGDGLIATARKGPASDKVSAMHD